LQSRVRFAPLLSLASLASLASLLALPLVAIACGGGEEMPATPPSPPPAATPPSPPTSPGMTGEPSKPGGETASPPAGKMAPLEIRAAAPPADPTPLPGVTIASPRANESVPAAKAGDFEVKLAIKDWPVAKDGPHIHLILDDKPYHAVHEPTAKVKLSELSGGEPIAEGEHVLIAFPSRETHISVKPSGGKKPYSAVVFWVGKAGKATWKPTDPTLIYSRPKGEYSGADAEKVVLDFYLLNAELGEGKHAVRATVTPASGMPGTLVAKTWAPYELVNLPHGEAKVKLELLDKDGNVVPGRFNSTERSIKLMRQGM